LIGNYVKYLLCTWAIALTFLSAPAQADPHADAKYIVSQTTTRAIFDGAIVAQRPLIIGALQNNLRAKGITLPDPDRFFDLLMEEFMDEFTQSMQDQSASIYLEHFSEQELADIADFYKTNSGQAFLSAAPTLMIAAAQMGQRASRSAGMNAGKRLAARIEAEGLIVVDDPSLLPRLLDSLR